MFTCVITEEYNSSYGLKKSFGKKVCMILQETACNFFIYIYKGKSAACETLLDSKLHKMAKIHAVKKSEPNSCAAVIPILVSNLFHKYILCEQTVVYQ